MNARITEADYAEAIGILREMEKTLLSREQWQRAADAPDAAETLRIIGGGYDFTALHTPEAYEGALQARLKETYDRLYKICPEPEVIDILNAKYVFHNLKVLAKSSVSEHARKNGGAILSEVAAVTPETIRQGEKGDCPAYALEALREMESAYTLRDPQAIDMAADRLMYERMRTLAEGLGNEYILRYTQMAIDLYNLRMLMRVRHMQRGPRFLQDALLPGGLTDTDLMRDAYDKPFDVIAAKCFYKYFGDAVKQSDGNISSLEKLTDNLLTAHQQQAKFVAFGPEPLFAYLLALENELRQIRIIVTCKLNHISDDVLRERLRDLYA